MMDECVTTIGLCKRYGSETCVDHLALKVPQGAVFGFLGPFGACKTTTLKLLLGLVHPSAGSVRLLGHELTPRTRLAILREVGALIESPSYYGHLTARENLEIVRRLRGLPAAEIDEALRTVRLDGQVKKPVNHFSLGMKQRLGIAAALMGRPRLLLLDEPTNGLDPSGVLDFRMLVRSLAADGTSVLISSHQLAEMELMCSRLIIIESGFIVSIKTLKELPGESDDIPVHYRLDVNDAARALKLLTDNGFSAETAESGLNVYMTRLQSAEAARLLVENNIAVYELTAVKKTLSDAFLEATGKRRRAKKK